MELWVFDTGGSSEQEKVSQMGLTGSTQVWVTPRIHLNRQMPICLCVYYEGVGAESQPCPGRQNARDTGPGLFVWAGAARGTFCLTVGHTFLLPSTLMCH